MNSVPMNSRIESLDPTGPTHEGHVIYVNNSFAQGSYKKVTMQLQVNGYREMTLSFTITSQVVRKTVVQSHFQYPLEELSDGLQTSASYLAHSWGRHRRWPRSNFK